MLNGIPLVALTPSALLGLAVLMLLTGRLVPRSTLRDKAEESERWRLAYEKEREARALSNSQTTELLELARTSNNVIGAMFSTKERVRESGGTDVVPSTK